MYVSDKITLEEHFTSLFDAFANFSPEKFAMIHYVLNYTKCYKLMYGIIVGINAQKILELGIGSEAISTYIFLEALKITGGHLTSVELNQNYGYEKFFNYDRNKWRVIHSDSASAPINDIFDVIMIDTSHIKEQTEKELKMYVPMLRKNGVLFMHDTNEAGVKEPLNDYMLKTPNVLEIFFIEDVPLNQAQMTILRKL